MSSRQLREQIENQAGRRLSEEDWQLLQDEGWVRDYEKKEVTLREIAAEIRAKPGIFTAGRRANAARRPRGWRGVTYLADDVLLCDPRTKAISEIVAHEAKALSDVRDFRRSVLRDRLLQPEDARLWIQKHSANRRNRCGSLGSNDPAVGFLTAGKRFTVWDRFCDLANYLALTNCWWQIQAGYFILTGQTPVVRPINPIRTEQNFKLPVLSRIVLSIDPVVPPDDVAAAYGRIRRPLLGRRSRRQSDRQVRLAVFWHTRPGGEKSRKTMKRWNEQCSDPKWRYDHLSNFTRDAHMAVRVLLRKQSRAEMRQCFRRL